MASPGDRVLFNEGDQYVASWAAGIVTQTDTSNPGAYDHFGGDEGNYPMPPATGWVQVMYAGLVGNGGGPAWALTYATEGTGPGQYQLLA